MHPFIKVPLRFDPFLTGLVLGFGYSLGELPNSFLKRRLEMGTRHVLPYPYSGLFRIFDQIDSVIGSLVALFFVYDPSKTLVCFLFLFGTALHVLVDVMLYRIGYKKKNPASSA